MVHDIVRNDGIDKPLEHHAIIGRKDPFAVIVLSNFERVANACQASDPFKPQLGALMWIGKRRSVRRAAPKDDITRDGNMMAVMVVARHKRNGRAAGAVKIISGDIVMAAGFQNNAVPPVPFNAVGGEGA